MKKEAPPRSSYGSAQLRFLILGLLHLALLDLMLPSMVRGEDAKTPAVGSVLDGHLAWGEAVLISPADEECDQRSGRVFGNWLAIGTWDGSFA